MGDAGHGFDLGARRMRPRERDVLGDRAVEQEVVLQHHAELRAIVGEPNRVEIAPVYHHAPALRSVECQHQTDQGTLARSR